MAGISMAKIKYRNGGVKAKAENIIMSASIEAKSSAGGAQLAAAAVIMKGRLKA